MDLYIHRTPLQFQPVSLEMVTLFWVADNLSAHLKSNYEFIVVSSQKSQCHKSFLSSALSLVKQNGNYSAERICSIKKDWVNNELAK